MDIKTLTATQFDEDARGWTEKMYARPADEMRRRAHLILDWGAPLKAGDRVLELGCGDGSLACFLARKGLHVTGLDISPVMIDEARARAAREGVGAEFFVGDVDTLKLDEPFDAAVSFMGAFFMYVEDPRRALAQLSPLVRKKIIVDWNHRSSCTPTGAAAMIEESGFERVEWRPWFLPLDARADAQLKFRFWLEERPLLSLVPLILKRWRYAVYMKGEKAGASAGTNGDAPKTNVFGNPVPGGPAQRALLRYGQVTRGKRRRV